MYVISRGKGVFWCSGLFWEALIYLAIGVFIYPCLQYHFIIIPRYRFLSHLCGYFVHVFQILLYVKEIVFTCVIYDVTVNHQSERDIPDFACPESCCNLDRGIPAICPGFMGPWVRCQTQYKTELKNISVERSYYVILT